MSENTMIAVIAVAVCAMYAAIVVSKNLSSYDCPKASVEQMEGS